tara:strand:- start:5204 stop:5770 length:567 start_codon:yes stop_codon:yes gene_type:complete
MVEFKDIWEDDAAPSVDISLTNDNLKEVSYWAQEQLKLEEKVRDKEESLADSKKALKDIIEQKLPDAMRECNLSEIKLADGSKITVQQFYSARIGKEREAEAFAWLKQNGHEDIIKNVISVQFGRGEDESASDVSEKLISQGYSPTNKRWVEPMTLKAFAREQVENGKDLPFDIFNVFVWLKTKITKG